MARIKKVSDSEIKDVLSLAEQYSQGMYDAAEVGRLNGFDSVPSLETALELLRFGSAIVELAQAVLAHIRNMNHEAQTRANLEKLYRERADQEKVPYADFQNRYLKGVVKRDA